MSPLLMRISRPAGLALAGLLCLATALQAQKGASGTAKLQSGPMVGYVEMREVMLWVQTTEAAQVWVEYVDPTAPTVVHKTNVVQTAKESAFTAHLLADEVLPGRDYEASVFLNGKRVALPYPFQFHSRDLWQWRADPPPFKAIVGSCAYFNDSLTDRPGKPYGSNYGIFEAIYKEKGDLMLWLGDNLYLNEPDWNTLTGMHHRYTHARSYAVLQPLLAQMAHYAIWDDHDYGPNDGDRSFVHKEKALQAFQEFWANPGYGVDGAGGITSMFSWSDCDFFLLDDRWFRAPYLSNDTAKPMLGEGQVRWLVDALRSSQATFKFVCVGSMVLSTAEVYENYVHVAREERQALLDAIQRQGIPGVIFLTGDRHHSEASRWKPAGGYVVHDFTVSPFTSGTYPGDGDKNTLLVPGSEFVGHNYATIDVSGPRTDRVLRLALHDHTGKEVWAYEIKAKEMLQR